MEEPGGLQSTGSQRVRHNWATSLYFSLIYPQNHHYLPFSKLYLVIFSLNICFRNPTCYPSHYWSTTSVMKISFMLQQDLMSLLASTSSFCVCVCISRSVFETPCSNLCLWNFPGKNTRVGNCSLLQVIFLTQGSNPGLLHCRQIFYQLNHQENPIFLLYSFNLSFGAYYILSNIIMTCIFLLRKCKI